MMDDGYRLTDHICTSRAPFVAKNPISQRFSLEWAYYSLIPAQVLVYEWHHCNVLWCSFYEWHHCNVLWCIYTIARWPLSLSAIIRLFLVRSQRPVKWRHCPIRSQYPGHVITLDQSEASIPVKWRHCPGRDVSLFSNKCSGNHRLPHSSFIHLKK